MRVAQTGVADARPLVKNVNLIEPRAFRIRDACQLLTISRSTIYVMAARGELRLAKIAGRTVVPSSEVARLLGDGEGAR